MKHRAANLIGAIYTSRMCWLARRCTDGKTYLYNHSSALGINLQSCFCRKCASLFYSSIAILWSSPGSETGDFQLSVCLLCYKHDSIRLWQRTLQPIIFNISVHVYSENWRHSTISKQSVTVYRPGCRNSNCALSRWDLLWSHCSKFNLQVTANHNASFTPKIKWYVSLPVHATPKVLHLIIVWMSISFQSRDSKFFGQVLLLEVNVELVSAVHMTYFYFIV